MTMEVNSAANFKAKLQRLIAYQDIFARNNLLAQRSCDHGLLTTNKMFITQSPNRLKFFFFKS